MKDEELLRHLIGWAILAPSSHNVQPWRFTIDAANMSINMLLHPSGILPISDKTGRQAHISMGCAVENLCLAAAVHGFITEAIFVGGQYPQPLIRVRLLGKYLNLGVDEVWLNFMKNRRMNRGLYYPEKPIPSEFLAGAEEAALIAGLKFHRIEDALTRFAIAEIQYQADRYIIAQNAFRHELGNYFLPNDSKSPVGMPGNNFGLSDEMSLRVHHELKKDGPFDHELAVGMATATRDGIRSSPLIAVLSVPSDEQSWWVAAGRVLEVIALKAEKFGLAVAVHAAIVEVEAFNKLLRLRLGSLFRPTVIFRVGFPKEDRPHSPRMSVDDVLEK